MEGFKKFFKWRRAILLCVTSWGMCAGTVPSAVAAEEPAQKDEVVKKDEAVKKDEPVKQSGSFLIKFKASVSDAKIQEVADYYGANKILPLSGAESTSHKDPEQWQKFKFDAVNDVKDVARRIIMDNRVDEVDDVIVKVNK